jgi:hypothetical protein
MVRLSKRIILIVSLTLIISDCVVAQNDRVHFGVGNSLGFTEHRAYYEKVKNTQVLGLIPASSSRLYAVINTWRNESKSLMSSAGLFQSVKLTLSGSARSGIYVMDNTPTKVDFSFIDFEAVIHLLAVDFSDQVQTYIAFGPCVGFLVGESEQVDKVENIQPGFVFEFGLRNTTGSFFGVLYMNNVSSYSPNIIALQFGVSFLDMKQSVAKAIQKRKNG